MKFVRLLPLTIMAALSSGNAAVAQDATSSNLSIEINDLTPSEKGCKLTFVAANELPQSLSKVSFEFVLFDEKGLV